MTEYFDIGQAVREMRDPSATFDRQRLAVWGGEFPESALQEFLLAWNLPRTGMPYCLWEWIDRLCFERELFPTDLDLLERGRVFGPQGDLSLRRDRARFLWHFVGDTKTTLPDPERFPRADFWQAHPKATLLRTEIKLLLWGEAAGQGLWREGRVARRDLKYPVENGPPRVQVLGWQFTQDGISALAWWYGLEAESK